jgi:hypothetical protein
MLVCWIWVLTEVTRGISRRLLLLALFFLALLFNSRGRYVRLKHRWTNGEFHGITTHYTYCSPLTARAIK